MKLVISRTGFEEVLNFVPFDPEKEPFSEDGNINFEVWTFENLMISDMVDLLFSF
jgi:hypothetical protein